MLKTASHRYYESLFDEIEILVMKQSHLHFQSTLNISLYIIPLTANILNSSFYGPDSYYQVFRKQCEV